MSPPGEERARESSTRRSRAARVLLAAAIACAVVLACRDDASEHATTPGTAIPPLPPRAAPRYASESTCVECHADEVRAWKGSQHAVAIQEASSETVLADFDAPPFVAHGRTTSFSRRDGRFFVETEGRDGKRATFPVRWTFGVAPLQQYLLELDHGRFGSLTIAWDVARKRWFDLYPDEDLAPGDELHWTGRYQRWNAMCAQCHSTDLQKNYDAASDGYATTWSEMTIGCQACHGPAQRHLDLARAKSATERDSGFDTLLRHGGQRAQLDACGPCHAMRSPIAERWVHGEPFLDHFLPELVREGSYAADGQLVGEAYVYGSFLQSRMHRRGVACSDCHEPHTLALRGSGNSVCAQCHQETPPVNRFPTLQRKRYDASEHTHHASGSPGSSCVACHMPSTTFMQIDTRHDHSFRIPRPDESVAFGVRNACNDCHADKDAAWAAEAASTWWPKLAERPTFTAAFARGRAGDESAVGELERIALDPERAPIVRGSALELAGALGAHDVATRLVHDGEPLVRLGALRGIEAASTELSLDTLRALLVDPQRALRVEAARVGAGFARRKDLDERAREDLTRASAEFLAAQKALDDFPGSHLNRAVVCYRRGEIEEAIAEYERALALDPAFLPARFNLASLLQSQQDPARAESVLRDGLRHRPDEAALHTSLAVLLENSGRDAEALAEYVRAAALSPRDAQAQASAAEALQRAGRDSEAAEHWRRVFTLDPMDEQRLFEAIAWCAGRNDWKSALPYAEQLARVAPDDPEARELVERVRREANAKR